MNVQYYVFNLMVLFVSEIRPELLKERELLLHDSLDVERTQYSNLYTKILIWALFKQLICIIADLS
jgi:hypothetical protein